MKPVVLPMMHLHFCHYPRDGFIQNVYLLASADAEHSLELAREYLDEAGYGFIPVVDDPFRARAAGQFPMPYDQLADLLQILRLDQRLKIHRVTIAAFL